MTGRWITVSLVALALASCNKKDEVKPPPPKPEAAAPVTTPAPAPTPAPLTEPEAAQPAVEPTPPPPGVTPTTSPDAPPTFIPTKPIPTPIRPVIRPPIKVIAPKPGVKIVRTKPEVKAQRDVLGLWVQQGEKKAILNFTADGKVSLRDKITSDPVWTGDWKAKSDGSVEFTLFFNNPSNPLVLTAYPTSAAIMAVAPHWTKDWKGKGQYAYERMK